MSFKISSRVQETGTVSGLGPVTLSGAVLGMFPFSSVLAEGDRSFALIEDLSANANELCAVTMTAGKLVRGAVIRSTNGGAPVSFAAGVAKTISLSIPGEKQLVIDDTGKTSAPTPAPGTNNNEIATTAFVASQRRAFDFDALAWENSVIVNGGTVSLARRILIDQLIFNLKAAGTWARTDDYWLLVAENAGAALTSLKQRRLATAVNSPVFTIDRGYAFDGVSQYLNSGFNPTTMNVAMTGSDLRIAVYERTNVSSNNFAAGLSGSSPSDILITPRTTSNTMTGKLNAGTTTISAPAITDSRGMWAYSRTAVPVFEHWKNGASLGQQVASAPGTVSGAFPLFVGARNNSGTAGSFRASTLGYVALGASLTAAQEASAYAAVQAFMTAVGANV